MEADASLDKRTKGAEDRAVDYLSRAQDADGAWRDFRAGIGGVSDEWVTAFVLHAVHPIARIRPTLMAAASYLATAQRCDGGWGYNARIPSDADTSAVAVLALRSVNGAFRTNEAIRFLRSHDTGSGFSTYKDPEELQQLYLAVPGREATNFAGWCESHAEVTAAVLESLLVSNAADQVSVAHHLRWLQALGSAGLWRGYWSVDAIYPTYRVARVLAAVGGNTSVLRAMRASIAALQDQNGSWVGRTSGRSCSFRTSLCIEMLLPEFERYRPHIFRGLEWLLGMQSDSGAWVTFDDYLRIPPPNVLNPDTYAGWGIDGQGKGATYRDPAGIVTTAVTLRALSQVHF